MLGGLIGLLFIGLFIGMCGGLINVLHGRLTDIESVEFLEFSLSRLAPRKSFQKLVHGMILGLGGGLSGGLVIELLRIQPEIRPTISGLIEIWLSGYLES